MSRAEEWHYLEDSEEIATRGSFKKMLVVTNYQTSGINAQVGSHAEIIPWKARRDPLALDYVNKYSIWVGSGGIHEGKRLTLNQGFALAKKQLNTIDIGIQTIAGGLYAKGTVNYATVFNNGHAPFNEGFIQTRIAEWPAFASRMGSDVNLASFKASALAIGVSLDGMRTAQSGSISNTNVFTGDLEAARVALCTMDYRNLGQYMDAYHNNHAMIRALCDTETIREHLQSKFTGTLTIDEVEGVLKHGFLVTDTFTAENTSDAPYAIHLGSVAHGVDSATITVLPHTKITVAISDFGPIDLNMHRFLTVTNLSHILISHYIIQL